MSSSIGGKYPSDSRFASEARIVGCPHASPRTAALTVLSIDLASRRYADNGIALLAGRPDHAAVQLLRPDALGLHGEPDVEPFADALATLAERERATLILLDGPQGWRAERSAFAHQRACERLTLTPGKTGLPGVVKPATWTRMALFSIALFDALHARGWTRYRQSWRGDHAAIESFPTHAWRMLGRAPLPGKSATGDLRPWRAHLKSLGVRDLPAGATHDEIQAVVAGLAGLALLSAGSAAVDIRGEEPRREATQWREGYIVSPRV